MLGSFARRSLTTTPAKFLSQSDRIFTNLWGDQSFNLAAAQKRGDWSNTDQLLSKGADEIRAEVKASEIRGRGGAGFSTGRKWEFMPKPSPKREHYLVINADEGEPGTFKDRQLLSNEPHKIIEGALLASKAVHAHKCYIYIRGEFRHEAKVVQAAIDEAYTAKLIGKENKFGYPFEMFVHRGAGAYICGEETALLSSLEGNAGNPRYKPPFPAERGLFKMPTIINNVETIASVPDILRRGSKWYSSIGIPNSRGTKVYGISGTVNKPCVFEESMGVSLRELIEKYGGGVKGGWDSVQLVIPGGLSCPPLTKEQAETAIMGYDELKAMGSSLGTAAIIVMDKSIDILKAYAKFADFYRHESCGQCGPCREGTIKEYFLVNKIAEGKGTHQDLDELLKVANETTNCVCALADASSAPLKVLVRNFRTEIEKRLID